MVLSTVIVTILSFVFLRENVTRMQLAGIVILIVAVITISSCE